MLLRAHRHGEGQNLLIQTLQLLQTLQLFKPFDGLTRRIRYLVLLLFLRFFSPPLLLLLLISSLGSAAAVRLLAPSAFVPVKS